MPGQLLNTKTHHNQAHSDRLSALDLSFLLTVNAILQTALAPDCARHGMPHCTSDPALCILLLGLWAWSELSEVMPCHAMCSLFLIVC